MRPNIFFSAATIAELILFRSILSQFRWIALRIFFPFHVLSTTTKMWIATMEWRCFVVIYCIGCPDVHLHFFVFSFFFFLVIIVNELERVYGISLDQHCFDSAYTFSNSTKFTRAHTPNPVSISYAKRMCCVYTKFINRIISIFLFFRNNWFEFHAFPTSAA